MTSNGRIRRKWTEEEDQALRVEAYSQVNQGALNDWHRIAAKLPGRTNKDCRKRWSKIRDFVKKGVWDAAEDKRLEDAVEKYGFRWTQVAQVVGTRHGDQCAKRWKHFLDPELDRSEWTPVDDERLVSAVDKYGRNWKAITNTTFPGRSPTNVKNRHAIMDRRRQAALGRHTPEKRKASSSRVESEDDSDDSASDEDMSSEEPSEPTSISSTTYSGDDPLMNYFFDSPNSNNIQMSQPDTAMAKPSTQDLHAVCAPNMSPSFDFGNLDSFLAPGPFSSHGWPGEEKPLDTSNTPFWQATPTVAPAAMTNDLEPTTTEHAINLDFTTSNVSQLVDGGVSSPRIILTLEDVQPETLGKLLDMLFKSKTRVKMETRA